MLPAIGVEHSDVRRPFKYGASQTELVPHGDDCRFMRPFDFHEESDVRRLVQFDATLIESPALATFLVAQDSVEPQAETMATARPRD